ncbi:unnamed protein product [Owenia fusiformis]|uniref:Nephrocystin-3 n=1 Tax=Owenia fusiformis TaxID=6347 RepID=A0A8S4PAQ7_OWEFU|nr:unnamed protein product [Owenia fusiformis]
MGTGSSLFHRNDEDDVLGMEYDSNSQGVIKRIPIEVKPRGKLGLRSVGSFGRKPKGGSLRSALSVDLENPEAEKIRKDFDMYRMNKESEIQNMQKKEQKLEMENKRLRGELQALQKSCGNLRRERDAAVAAEQDALARGSAFRDDRDKVQRQFKLFRETKEHEIQNLLKARRQLETKLSRLSQGSVIDDPDSVSRTGVDISLGGGNPGDWWTALESEPSLGSSTQLHQQTYMGPEFAQSIVELNGPFTNVNKEDWHAAAASLAQVVPVIPETITSAAVRIYVAFASDTQGDVEFFLNTIGPKLQGICEAEGRYLLIIHMPITKDQQLLKMAAQSRISQAEGASIFLGILAEQTHRSTNDEFSAGHFNNPGAKPCLVAFHAKQHQSRSQTAVDKLKKRLQDSHGVKIFEYSLSQNLCDTVYYELEKITKIELGINIHEEQETTGSDSGYSEAEADTLCIGGLWDLHGEIEQAESLLHAVRSSCELGFEKYYERLNCHVAAAGPLSPLLITGDQGSGRSLLLAKWIPLFQHRGGGLVLYHFVGMPSSSSADPVLMIRRFTSQLMQHVTSPPALTCDPGRLVDEFPRWLEKVSSKTPGGIILVLDSIDRFQQAEVHLKWLLDPLPVDTRVIVSVHKQSCPKSWRSWPSIHLEPLSNKNVRELLHAELASLETSMNREQESRVLTHCRTAATCSPLYVTLLSSDLAGCGSKQLETKLDCLLAAGNTSELYKLVIDGIIEMFDDQNVGEIVQKVLLYINCTRNGLGEWELMSLIPELTWTLWAPIYSLLEARHILKTSSSLITISHEIVQDLVAEMFSDQDEVFTVAKGDLIAYFSQFLIPGSVTCRVADELPWLLHSIGDKEQLQAIINNLCIFQRLYGRGRCRELIGYWQYVGADKNKMAQSYFAATKKMEEFVGGFNGMVTLPRIADMYEALGRFLRDLGLLAQASTPLQRALEVRETALDPDHPSVAQSLHQLAGLHAQWNKFSTAEALYKQALDIYESAFGSNHPLVAKELDSLAVLFQKQDKHELAEPLHMRAVAIRKKTGLPRIGSGQLKGVDTIRRRVLQLEELALGPDSPDHARTLNELGVLNYLQNNQTVAESFFQRSLAMREAVLESDHPDLAQSLNNLAALYNDRKQYNEAAPLYERALLIRRKVQEGVDSHRCLKNVTFDLNITCQECSSNLNDFAKIKRL